ncbi:hypothetical protein AB0B15_36730 [Streptomyces sp. NPDC045456]|uniref:hypothetical protein n=1 Tax=Streptomyces sp. NPDC045456 TaxID=3155254 RepID=UPI0033F6EA24
MSFTTPPRPLDVAALFPQLAPLARTATRLHPRPGSPSAHDSSVGGPLLWPADEPWPYCAGPHVRSSLAQGVLAPEDVRVLRRIRAAVASRRNLGRQASRPTPEELATEKRISEGRPWPEGPVAMLPVAQLYLRDIPQLRTFEPPGADLLQVLWCPFDHPENPRTALFWRSAAEVTDVLAAAPEPPVVQLSDYLPEPCMLAPEQVTEYPHLLELSKKVQNQLGNWDTWRAADSEVDSSYASAPKEFYAEHLSVAPGWKVGGWSRWGLTDPMARRCPECATEMDPLLTIASTEWNASSKSWAPEEERTNPTPLLPGTPPANFTMITLARGYDLQLHSCPAAPHHPHIELIQ